jgi:hypothetical protein
MGAGGRRFIVLAVALLSTAAFAPAGGSQASGFAEIRKAENDCGTAEKFSHQFGIRTRGGPISCGTAREVIDAPCKLHLRQRWSCFSFRAPHPFIVWFPSKQIWDRRWKKAILYRRYPCSEAVLTPDLFARWPRGFPSLRQLLADDIIRCDLLAGRTYLQVRRLLGQPQYGKKGRYLSYVIGAERDSYFQIDPELLSVSFNKRGLFAGATIYQG